mgnify:CR=1 FL=1
MRTSQRLDVRMPPAEVAAELKLSPFEPTVYIVSTGYSQNGIAVEYSEAIIGKPEHLILNQPGR